VDEYCRKIYNPGNSSWLAQANDIFNRLEISRDFENFGIFPVSRHSNWGAHFPQFWPILSPISFIFLNQQTIYLPATSFCAPWPSSKQKTRHASEFLTA
jgi:hypothetical protein